MPNRRASSDPRSSAQARTVGRPALQESPMKEITQPAIPKPAITKPTMKLADEVWVATLMLHQRHPERPDFLIEEIVELAGSAKELRFTGPLRPGFYVHVVQHCVAIRPPNPGRYSMLFETSPGRP